MKKDQIMDDTIHNVLKAVLERKEGYKKASASVGDDELSEIFDSYAKQSEDFALELVSFSKISDNDILNSNNLGNSGKFWSDIKSLLSDSDKRGLLDTCIAGEEAVLSKYNEIIDKQNLSDELFNLVDQQREKIEDACENIRMQLNAG